MSYEDLMRAIKKAAEFFFSKLDPPHASLKIIKEQIPEEDKEKLPVNASGQGKDKKRKIIQIPSRPGENFFKNVHIYCHLDADGLCSAAILAKTLQKKRIGFQISILRQLETDYIKDIAENSKKYNKFIIFADFGTGQIDIVKKYMEPESYLILDHHSPPSSIEKPEINHINPHFYGFNGSYEISGAGICYLFSRVIDNSNNELAWMAIVGAIGDIQTKGEKETFLGLNKRILEDAKKNGTIKTELDLAISRTRPLPQAIAYTLPIPLKGITDREDAAKRFLEAYGIKTTNELNEPRTLKDLTKLEKRTLSRAIIEHALVKNNQPSSISKKLVRTFYLLEVFDPRSPLYDARELSSLLNACGRSGKPGLGISVLLGDKEAIKEAIDETRNYKKTISRAIQFAKEHIRDMENIKYVYGKNIDEKIIGTVASVLIHSTPKMDKPLIAYADSDNHMLKVSARAPKSLVKKGLDLGIIMREVCSELNLKNPAGGHSPAAGARIPSMKLKDFLEKVDIKVAEQLNNPLPTKKQIPKEKPSEIS